MNEPVACELAHLDASYVLGALSPEERLEFERHLPGCPACSRAVQELAGMPGLLAQVSPRVLDPDAAEAPVPDTLLPSLVREVRRTQRRRRWGVAGIAAATVLALGGGTLATVNAIDDNPSSPPSAVSPAPSPSPGPMTQIGQHDLTADVALTPVAWGTRLDLICHYAPTSTYSGTPEYGDTPNSTYALVVRTRNGGVERVATWRALPGKTMSLTGATALSPDQISSVEVRGPGGQRVLELQS